MLPRRGETFAKQVKRGHCNVLPASYYRRRPEGLKRWQREGIRHVVELAQHLDHRGGTEGDFDAAWLDAVLVEDDICNELEFRTVHADRNVNVLSTYVLHPYLVPKWALLRV